MAGSMGGVRRPFGVTLVAFLTLVAAMLQLRPLAQGGVPDTQAAEVRPRVQLTAVWAAVGLVSAAGLFGMRRWGWWLAMIYYAGTLLLLGLDWSARSVEEIVFKAGLSVLVIWYLASRDVRRSFRGTRGGG